ncbi:MAG: MFS transporter [Chloroflexi bacterium]|nr:MFS transporter [Chloroflexota bacterium]
MSNVAAPSVPLSPEVARSLQANVWKFYLFRFFVDFQLWLPIWAVYLIEERGLSLTQLTALDAPFWILLIVLEVPTGAIADRWGRKVSLSYGALTNAIAVVVFGIATNFGVLLISYMVWAAAFTLYSGADSAFVYDSLRAVGRERDYPKLWGRARAIQAVGAILGLLIGSLVAHYTTLWIPVVASGGLMGVAWLVSFSFKEPPRFEETDGQQSYLTVVKEAFGVAFGRPSVRYMMLLTAGVMGVGVSMIILQQPFLDSHDMPIWSFGLFLTPGQLLSMVGALITYRVITLLGVSRIIVLMPIVVMITAVGLGAIDYVAAFAFYPLTTTMFAMSFVVISDYLNRRIPSANRATILSIHNMIFSLAVAGMEPLLGWLGDTWGLPLAYRAAAIIVVVLAAPLLALWLRAHRQEQLLGEELLGAPDAEPQPAEPP